MDRAEFHKNRLNEASQVMSEAGHPEPFIWASPDDYTAVATGEYDSLGPVYERREGHHALWIARLEGAHKAGRVEWSGFLGSLHPPAWQQETGQEELWEMEESVSFSLRLTADQVYLTGKAFGESPDEARLGARTLWKSCLALLPPAVNLFPAVSAREFEKFSGLESTVWEKFPVTGLETVEFLRKDEAWLFEEGAGSKSLYLLYPFNLSPEGWLALTGLLEAPLALIVTLRPARLFQRERLELENLCTLLAEVMKDESKAIYERYRAESSYRLYRSWLRGNGNGFIIRIYLTATGQEIPAWPVQKAGSLLAQAYSRTWKGPAGEAYLFENEILAAYSCIKGEFLTDSERKEALRNLVYQEPYYEPESEISAIPDRLRYFFNTAEATALFIPPAIPARPVTNNQTEGEN